MPDPGIELDEGALEMAARALHDRDIAERAVDLSYPECADLYRVTASLAISTYLTSVPSVGPEPTAEMWGSLRRELDSVAEERDEAKAEVERLTDALRAVFALNEQLHDERATAAPGSVGERCSHDEVVQPRPGVWCCQDCHQPFSPGSVGEDARLVEIRERLAEWDKQQAIPLTHLEAECEVGGCNECFRGALLWGTSQVRYLLSLLTPDAVPEGEE